MKAIFHKVLKKHGFKRDRSVINISYERVLTEGHSKIHVIEELDGYFVEVEKDDNDCVTLFASESPERLDTFLTVLFSND